MNGLTFRETPSQRNAPWSAYRDDYGDEPEPTDAELARATFLESVRMARDEARWAFCRGGLNGAELDRAEAWALGWGVK